MEKKKESKVDDSSSRSELGRLLDQRISRRRAVSKAAGIAVAGVVGLAIGGSSGYLVGSGTKQTVTQTTTVTETRTAQVTSTTQAATTSRTANVRIGILSNAGEATVQVANDAGLFQKYGINSTIIPFPSPGPQVDAFIKGEIDLTDQALGPMVSLASSTNFIPRLMQPMVWIGKYNGKSYPTGVALVSSASAGTIKSIKDLKGKTLSTLGTGTLDYAVARIVLIKAGLDPAKDVSFVPLAYPNTVQALSANKVDATLHIPAPFWLQAVDKGFARVLDDPTYNPGGLSYVTAIGTERVPINGVWANDSFLNANPGACSGIMRGMSDAVSYIQSNPDQAASIIAKYTQVDLDTAKKSLSVELFIPYPNGFTDWQQYYGPIYNAMLSNNLIQKTIDLKPLVTSSCFSP